MLNGIICVNKPEGFTSFDVIAKLRGILKMKRLGHSGTLDPMATGVLPVFAGSATKAVSILNDTDKSYLAGFRLGIVTDTQDITGKILEEKTVCADTESIERVAKLFRGNISQIPPMYSAVSVGGKRLYELARKGIEVERTPREITVDTFEIREFDEKSGEGRIAVACSKGTYIRTLIHDMGQELGCGAVMTSLVRTAACGFTLEDCYTLEEIQKLADENRVREILKSTEKLFEDYPALRLNAMKTKMYKNGVKLRLSELAGFDGQELVRIYSAENKFIGIAKADFENGVLRVLKNLDGDGEL
ncbi:tRNA pseudouridine(55) synthase TruB [Porcipelethomonas sp.]|uniref:tRNA pseudouridine(55) synthase TruB n=1 Tax=Porcipelethomonas sp. TaxID=2981675 RepID=UPI003EF1740E